MRRSAVWLFVVPTAVATLVGCGGGDGGLTLDPASGPPGTQFTWSPKCAGEDGTGVDWEGDLGVDPSGRQLEFGALVFPGDEPRAQVSDLEPGTYTVKIDCIKGDGSDVLLGRAQFTVS